MSKLTDDEKVGLSPEEIAAIEDGDEDSTAELKEIAEGDDTTDEDEGDEAADGEDGDAEDEESDEDGGDDKDKGGATDAKAAAKEEEAEETSATDFAPRLTAQEVTDFDAKINEITTAKAALAEQFEAGDMKHSEYMAKRDELVTQEIELRTRKANADFVAENNANTGQQRWEWEQDRFLEEHAIYREDPMMHAALDAAVKGLASAKDDAGKLVNDGKSLKWFLDEAHRQVSKRFRLEEVDAGDGKDGKDGKQGKDGKPAVDGKKGKSRAGQPPNLKEVPKTVGNLPAAESSEASESEFDKIDKLTGIEYEQALANMTPEQQERYLKAG